MAVAPLRAGGGSDRGLAAGAAGSGAGGAVVAAAGRPGLAQPPHDWCSSSRKSAHSDCDREVGYGIGRTAVSELHLMSNWPSPRTWPM